MGKTFEQLGDGGVEVWLAGQWYVVGLAAIEINKEILPIACVRFGYSTDKKISCESFT